MAARWPVKAKGRPRPKQPGDLTKLEAAWAAELELAVLAGEMAWVGKHGSITLKLAPDTRYTPDFAWVAKDGTFGFDECKGFMEDDAWVKLKVAAALFPMRFRLVTRDAKKDGGRWRVKEVGDD